MKKFLKDESGVAIYEYALIISAGGAIILGLVGLAGGAQNTFVEAGKALSPPGISAPPPPMSTGTNWAGISNNEASGLAGAGSQQVVASAGNPPSNGSATTVSAWGDPHITTSVGGNSVTTTSSSSDSNFATYQNTGGGATTFGLQVTGSGKQVSGSGVQATNYSIHSVDVTSGSGWSFTSTDTSNNNITTMLNTGSGIIMLSPGKIYTEPDGSKINVAFNGAITLTQNLSSGGTLTSTIIQDSYNGDPFLDLNQSTTGDLVISGAVAGQITGTPGISVITL